MVAWSSVTACSRPSMAQVIQKIDGMATALRGVAPVSGDVVVDATNSPAALPVKSTNGAPALALCERCRCMGGYHRDSRPSRCYESCGIDDRMLDAIPAAVDRGPRPRRHAVRVVSSTALGVPATRYPDPTQEGRIFDVQRHGQYGNARFGVTPR